MAGPSSAAARSRDLLVDALLGASVFVVLGIAWDLAAHAGWFPARLFPTLGSIGDAFLHLVHDGVLLKATKATLGRLVAGFLLGATPGLALGLLMGRFAWLEDFLMPVVDFFYSIPGIAYAPLFVLWFGVGDRAAIVIVAFTSSLPVLLNTWRGVHSVREIWLRAARVMGASDATTILRVMFPASLPYILAGLRIGLGNGWRVLIAVEMLTSVSAGLGWVIFNSQQFLDSATMLAAILVIGVIGVAIELAVFGSIERRTIARWGMAVSK